MFDDLRPFELLRLIREGVVASVADLGFIAMSLYWGPINRILEPLQDLGLIHVTKDGVIQPSKEKYDSLMSLGISLTQLAPYGNQSVVVNPIFGKPKDPPKPSTLFVMMPFASDIKVVYEHHIRAVAARLGVTAARADDFFSANSIISDVWNAIARAQILIADCTGRNPNVFYELGIAHTLGKPVILLAQNREDIPFDVQHIRAILYNLTQLGMQDFETALESTVKAEMERRTLSDLLAEMKERRG